MTTVTAICTALETATPEHATLFKTLLYNGKNSAWKALAAEKRNYGPTEDDSLYLGRKISQFSGRDLPTLQDILEICLKDLPSAHEDFGSHLIHVKQDGTHEDRDKPTEDETNTWLSDNLRTCPLPSERGVLNFPSESMEDMRDDLATREDVLCQTMMTMTVLSNDTFIPLHHSGDGTTTITALSGTVLWIIWPSTQHNLNALHAVYNQLAENIHKPHLNLASAFEGGVLFTQSKDDNLRIPPFSPMMCLASGTVVLTSSAHVTARHIVHVLSNLAFISAFFDTEINGEEKQAKFIISLLQYLDLMLNGDTEDEERNELRLQDTQGGPLESLLRTWDDAKNALAKMMSPEDVATLQKIWIVYLMNSKGRECRLCGKRISNKKKEMNGHWRSVHWVAEKKRKSVTWEDGGDVEMEDAE